MIGDFEIDETCCGSAGLTLRLLGAEDPILSYQGGKWKYSRSLQSLLCHLGHVRATKVRLNDIGPWGTTWAALSHPVGLRLVIEELERRASEDPRQVYDSLQGSPVSATNAAFAHLFLQRLSIKGKAVGTVLVQEEEHWRSPGFSTSSAYGKEATDKFGKINPMILSMISTLEHFSKIVWPEVRVTRRDARDLEFDLTPLPRVVYIDPNYRGTTPYPNGGLSRGEVVDLALRACRTSTVLVSEREVIEPLLDHGFSHRVLREAPIDRKPFQSKDPEIVMFRRFES